MNQNTHSNHTIILAGVTGDLGGRVARFLLQQGAVVRALVRPGKTNDKLKALQKQGMLLLEVDFASASALTTACAGGTCVVSALSGLREVMVETQTALLQAAVAAGVPRFIPSDYAIDFTKLPRGTNRNLDLRQEFAERIAATPIAATSILNGMFSDLLTGQAPLVLFPVNRVMYWGNPDQLLDFTTVENTAEYTAAAALDAITPRFLRIAGNVLSARGLQEAASKATGKHFRLLRLGGLGALDTLIKITRIVSPQNQEVFPPWQGMQYLRNMLSGLPKLEPLDNNRYPHIQWTTVQEVLASRAS
ncbi:NmrA family NAD(P)-binding protein [Adhaeribacter pallidiroseus]|uniref:NmrA family NAD(P)-binding protein n=1 Tax=Adhaeribacter pallidiroseus TaxID=2072847 RepID=UPI001F491F1D|nr:NmrA family NAD(P)-binding protein [Adhaeribacter pallidiroseus]